MRIGFLVIFFWVGAFSLIASSQSLCAAEPGGTLTIEIRGIKSVKGVLMIGIFDSEGNFKVKPHVFSPKVPVTKKPSHSVDIKGLPQGSYALIAYQDLDEDKELAFNKIGIPLEPVTFSKKPKVRWGPPTFDGCSFELSGENKKVSMKLFRVPLFTKM